MKRKMLVMTMVILAVVALLSVKVSAVTNDELISYLSSTQTINGKSYTLTADQKATVNDYLKSNPVDDSTAASIEADIEAAKAEIKASGVTDLSKLNESAKSKVISLVKSAGDKAGVAVTVDTTKKGVTVVDKTTGKTLVSADYSTYTNSQTSGTLVYTGTNTLVYVIPALAIVAVAIFVVVRKRK